MADIAYWGAPGTGKTHQLIKEYKKTKAHSVTMTTFRRDTAEDIRIKIYNLLHVHPKKIAKQINTIHGVCYGLIGGPEYAKVLKDSDISNFNQKYGYNFKRVDTVEKKGVTEHTTDLSDCYAWLTNTETPLSSITQYPNFKNLRLSASVARDQLKHYNEWKEENGLVDFTDMLLKVANNNLTPPSQTLIVDEFQDLTAIQHRIFKNWSEAADTTIIAGDPLQSIYGFWGGSPVYFKHFDGERVVLPLSYRLPPQIWKYARELVTANRMETPDIQTADRPGNVRYITYLQYISNPDQCAGTKENTVYHLVRANYQAVAIGQVLAENGIIWDGLGGWTQNELDFLNAIIYVRTNQPLKKPHLRALVNQYGKQYFNYTGTKKELLNTINNMKDTQLPDTGLLTQTLSIILKMPQLISHTLRPSKTKATKIMNALQKHTKPISSEDIHTTITTIHGAKGGERDRVFLHTGITPTIKKHMRYNSAAEARVFFVGITRAKQELIIVKDKGQNYNCGVVA